ncbi:hypothetical protein Tco_1035841 [Tanacetum coccineum]
MLNNQKSSRCKIGIGFDSSKASTSGTKPINFVTSSAEIAPDGSTIKAHGSTIHGSVDPSSSEKAAEHVFSLPMSSRSDFVITRKKLIHNKIEESKKPSLKPSLKNGLGYVKTESSPPPTKLSPLVDDDVGEEEAIENNTKVVNNSNKEDESIEVDEVVNIKESKNHRLEQVIEEDDDMKVDIEEDENELELTYPYEEVDPLNPPPPASDSEPEDVIEVEDTIESEDETVPDSVHKVGESSTAPFLREDSDGLFPGLMRRDINSLFVRSSVEQGMTAMEKLVEKLGNAREKAECEKLKKELEKARFSNTFFVCRTNESR